MALRFFLLMALVAVGVQARTQRTMRYISWNVADNKRMNNAFDPRVVRQLLGMEALEKSPKEYVDVYAISLQENCYECNSQNVGRLAKVFLDALNAERRHQYEMVGQMATRVSTVCENVACATGQHGTTIMLVIAKRNIARMLSTFHTNKCNDAWIKNSEKGIATVKFQLRESGSPAICVSALHLDSESPQARQSCFTEYKKENAAELRGCQVIFYAGDYNTRTGDKGGKTQSINLSSQDVNNLKPKDEMVGTHPYGGKRLIDFISQLIGKKFSEPSLSFYPTYSLKPIKECRNRSPCYRGDRPPSWTDRIICTACSNSAYYSLPIQSSDHSPVIGIYKI